MGIPILSLIAAVAFAQASTEPAHNAARFELDRTSGAVPAKTEIINKGYLVIEGKEIKPPFKVEIIDGKVLVNGIQAYPHISTRGELAVEKEKKDAHELLDSLHEEFIAKRNKLGHDVALKWLRAELNKYPRYKNHLVQETARGVEVNLKGFTDNVEALENLDYMRLMREDNAPSRERQIQIFQNQLYEKYDQWRLALGKDAALGLLDNELKHEPLVEKHQVDRENESYDVLWRDQPDIVSVGLGVEGFNENNRGKAWQNQYRLNYHMKAVTNRLKHNDCIIIIMGGVYPSINGKSACDDILTILHDRPSKEQAMPVLAKHFRGKKRDIWNRLKLLWR
jgi:hypothetical protein